jgi:hypothetical protein
MELCRSSSLIRLVSMNRPQGQCAPAVSRLVRDCTEKGRRRRYPRAAVWPSIVLGAARAEEDDRTLLLASGAGAFLMGLDDLQTLIGAARIPIVVVYNYAAYGARIHQNDPPG